MIINSLRKKVIKGVARSFWNKKLQSRGLSGMNKHIGEKGFLEKIIADRLSNKDEVKILEIGFGRGKCLVELASYFAGENIKIYGINKTADKDLQTASDLKSQIGFFKKKPLNLDITRRIMLKFYDIEGGLDFPDEYFDFIYSQACVIYIRDKIKLFEEAWRVLKIGGSAYLHIDGSLTNENFDCYPKEMRGNNETPKLIINHNGKAILLSEYLKKYQNTKVKIELINSQNTSRCLKMQKITDERLILNLKLDTDKSIDLNTIYKGQKINKKNFLAWNGFQSVYIAKIN